MADRLDYELRAIEADKHAETAYTVSMAHSWRDIAREYRLLADFVADEQAQEQYARLTARSAIAQHRPDGVDRGQPPGHHSSTTPPNGTADRLPAEVAHQRTEPAPLDQPVKGIRIPLATGLPYERLEVAGAADRDQGAEIAELARADDGRD